MKHTLAPSLVLVASPRRGAGRGTVNLLRGGLLVEEEFVDVLACFVEDVPSPKADASRLLAFAF